MDNKENSKEYPSYLELEKKGTLSERAEKYSAEAYNYPHHAKLALKEMYRQVGDLKLDSRGIAVRGLMVRHLILPNRIACLSIFFQ